MAQTAIEESGELKDRKSYMLKIKEMIRDLRKCESFRLLIGFRSTRIWCDDKATYAIRGNAGCETWLRMFGELSKTGTIWEINDENRHLRVARREEEYRQLARRFGR